MFIKSQTTASILLGSLRQTDHDFSGGKTNNLSSCSHTESMLDEFANLSLDSTPGLIQFRSLSIINRFTGMEMRMRWKHRMLSPPHLLSLISSAVHDHSYGHNRRYSEAKSDEHELVEFSFLKTIHFVRLIVHSAVPHMITLEFSGDAVRGISAFEFIRVLAGWQIFYLSPGCFESGCTNSFVCEIK